jgi:hypothetical protein
MSIARRASSWSFIVLAGVLFLSAGCGISVTEPKVTAPPPAPPPPTPPPTPYSVGGAVSLSAATPSIYWQIYLFGWQGAVQLCYADSTSSHRPGEVYRTTVTDSRKQPNYNFANLEPGRYVLTGKTTMRDLDIDKSYVYEGRSDTVDVDPTTPRRVVDFELFVVFGAVPGVVTAGPPAPVTGCAGALRSLRADGSHPPPRSRTAPRRSQ